MFYHLHRNSLQKRPKNSKWTIFPDEQLEIDWNTVRQCLEAVGKHRELINMPLFGDFFSDLYYEIIDFRQVKSHESLCCQIADLFSGLIVFSKVNYNGYKKWKERNIPTFFPEVKSKFSNSEEDRFEVLEYFNSECKKRRLYVGLDSTKCLYTYKPEYPINFWYYEPQHEKDKAPTSNNRR
jgi:hypothetical protein